MSKVKFITVKIFALTYIFFIFQNIPVAIASSSAAEEKPSAENAEPVVDDATLSFLNDGYKHNWSAFPVLKGKEISGTLAKSYPAIYGHLTVAVFLASWCIPCQKLMPKLKLLEEKYRPFNVDFIYVFSHDVSEDAASFAKTYKLDATLIPSDDTLMFFKNPPLPSVFIADKFGWYTKRYNATTLRQLEEMDNFLAVLSVY